MTITRTGNYKEVELSIVGSSVFGRVPKISIEKTQNLFVTDTGLVNYSGYNVGLNYLQLGGTTTSQGRGCFSSIKLNCMIIVVDNRVYKVTGSFNQTNLTFVNTSIAQLGTLNNSTGVVYFAENNKPQILISNNVNLYVYDPTQTPVLQIVTTSFTPGFITFHDTYFLCAAQIDPYQGPTVTNTWRLSAQNNGLSWPDTSNTIGLLQTKSDNCKAVVRFPSKGNMVFVMGQSVTEAWYDTAALQFPYQRANQFNIDYGCVSPATVAYMDEIVVWLAGNERSGPIIMYSDGGMPKQITTDGMDYLFATFTNPADSQGFLYRQDGHLFYHINFYTDNQSFVYDFTTHKFYNITDQNLNYFIAGSACFYNQQYFFTSKNTGNLYMLDTQYTVYQDTDKSNAVPPNLVNYQIPRYRTTKNIRQATQDYFIANDLGFTIETGETNYLQQITAGGAANNLIFQNGNTIITQTPGTITLTDQAGNIFITQNGFNLIAQGTTSGPFNLVTQSLNYIYTTPRIDLSISRDGGATFGEDYPYVLNAIGQRRNKLNWWQVGMVNDLVVQVKYWSTGRCVLFNGVVNVRT